MVRLAGVLIFRAQLAGIQEFAIFPDDDVFGLRHVEETEI
jgi:hypothetical protein